MGYYIGTLKNRVSAKFLHTLYTIKSVYIEFLEPIKNRVSAKSVLKEAVYNEALLYSTILMNHSEDHLHLLLKLFLRKYTVHKGQHLEVWQNLFHLGE